MTPQQFAKKIRDKYPQGVSKDGRKYAEIPDIELSRKIITKYPVYASQVQFPVQKEPGAYEKVVKTGQNFAQGFTKGILSTGMGIGTIGQTLLDQTAGRVVSAVSGKGFTPTKKDTIFTAGTPSAVAARQFLQPKTTAEKLGFGVEQAAEYLLPASKAVQIKGPMNILGQFLTNAGVGAAQSGGKLSDTLTAGAIGSAFAVPAVALEASKPLLIKTMAFLSGYADDVLKTALNRTPGAIQATRGGEPVLNEVIRKTASSLSTYADDTLKQTKNTVAELSKMSAGGKGYPGTRQMVLQSGSNFIGNITNKLRGANIGVDKTGNLLFNRASAPSNIVSGGDQKAIQDAFKAVANITKDTSIKNIDSVIERLIVLKKKTPAGAPTGGETRLLIQNMIDDVVKFVDSTAPASKAYKQYSAFLKENLPVRVFIGDAKEIFGTSRNLSPKEVSQISTKVLQLFNSGKLPVKELAEKVGGTVGTDIVGAGAGTLLKAGDQISIRAPNLTQRGVIEKVVEFVPRALIRNYVATGNLVALEKHPIIALLGSVTGTATRVLAQQLADWVNQSEEGDLTEDESLLQSPQPQQQKEISKSSPESITKDELIKQTYAQMPKLDPTGAMGVGGMATKVAMPVFKEAAEVAAKMTIKQYKVIKEGILSGNAAKQMEALNMIGDVLPDALKAPVDDVIRYGQDLVKAYERSL